MRVPIKAKMRHRIPTDVDPSKEEHSEYVFAGVKQFWKEEWIDGWIWEILTLTDSNVDKSIAEENKDEIGRVLSTKYTNLVKGSSDVWVVFFAMFEGVYKLFVISTHDIKVEEKELNEIIKRMYQAL